MTFLQDVHILTILNENNLQRTLKILHLERNHLIRSHKLSKCMHKHQLCPLDIICFKNNLK